MTAHDQYNVISAFANASNRKYGSYAHAVGYLGQTVVNLLQNAPEWQREEVLRFIKQSTKELKETA